MTIVFKNLFIILISIFLVLVGIDFVIDNPYTQKFFRAYISKLVENESNLSFEFETLEIGLIPIQLDFFGITLATKSEHPAPPLATATQVKISVSLISLFFARPNFLDLAIDGLNLKWPPSTALSIPKDEALEPSHIPIDNVKLTNSQFLFDFSPGETRVSSLHLAGVNATGSFEDWDNFQASLSVLSVHLSIDNKELLVGTRFLVSQFSLTKHEFELRHVLVKDALFTTLVDAHGFLGFEKDKVRSIRLDGSLNVDADLHLLEKWLDWKKTSGGGKTQMHFSSHIPIEFPEDTTFLAEGEVEAKDATLAGNRIYNSRSFFRLDNEQIQFDNVELKIGDKRHGDLNGKIVFTKQVDFEFSGKAWDLPLTQIVSSFGANVSVIDFIANSDQVRFKGVGDPFSMDLWTNGELVDLHFPDLPIQTERYKRLPSCRAKVHLFFTEDYLDFKDTEGLCYIPPEKAMPSPSPPPDALLEAPEGALFASRVSVRDSIHFHDGPDMKLIGVNADLGLSQSFFQVDLHGLGNIETHIFEKNKEVSVINKFDVQSLSVEKATLGNAQGTLTVLKDHLRWDNVQISKEDLRLSSISGLYSWKKDQLKFSLSGERLSESDVSQLFAIVRPEGLQPYSFSIESFKGNFDIPTKDPWFSHNNLELKLRNLRHEDNLLASGIRATLIHRGLDFQVPTWIADFGSLALTGSASLRKHRFASVLEDDDELEIRFASDKTHVSSEKPPTSSQLENLLPLKRYLDPLKVAGNVQVSGQLKGKIARLSGHWDGKLTGLSINRFPVYPISFQGFVNASKMQIFLGQSGNNLVGRMNYDLASPRVPFSWYFNLKQFDMRPFTKETFYQDARNFAYLTANWTMDGELSNWWQANGKMAIEDLRISYMPGKQDLNAEALVIKNTQPAILLSSPKGWIFEDSGGLSLEGPDTKARIFLPAGNRPPESLDIRINAEMNLSILSQLFTIVQSATGTLAANMKISGRVDNPSIEAKFLNAPNDPNSDRLPLSLSIPSISPSFQDISVDASYLNGVLTVRNVSGKKGKGTFKIDGTMNFSSNQEKAMTLLNVKLAKFALNYPLPYLRMIQTVLDGELTISGKGKPFDVSGNIGIVSAQTERTLDTKTENIREIPIGDMVRGFQEDDTSTLKYNIAIEGKRSIRVQNQAMNLIMSSDLLLKGTNDKPVIEGILKVDEGKFRYQRDFIISRGELVFDNPLQNNPKLDILASSEINPYTITVYISGEGTKPLIDVVVDPPTKEDGSIITRLDAIILLSQGKLPEAESRTQDTRNVGVMAALNLYASQLPFHKFNELTGQKYISPYVNYTTDEQGNLVPQLNVPIRITDVIEAVVRQIPNTTLLTVEFPLHHNISVSGNASSTQRRTDVIQEESQFQSGIDLRFAFPFK